MRGRLIAGGGVPVSPGEGVEVPVRSQAQVDPGFQSDCVWSSDPICNDRVFLKTPQDPKGGSGTGDRQVLSARAPLPDGPPGRLSLWPTPALCPSWLAVPCPLGVP